MKTPANGISLEAKREIVTEFIRLKDTEIRCLRRLQSQRGDATSQEHPGNPPERPGQQWPDESERPVTALDQALADRDALARIDGKTTHDAVSPGALLRKNVGFLLVITALR